MANQWVYVLSDTGPDYRLYTVGFYAPDGTWHSDSDFNDAEEAARRVHFLNGGEDVLDKPAQIGASIFGVGINYSTVIGRAQREFVYQQSQGTQAERIAQVGKLMDTEPLAVGHDLLEGMVLLTDEQIDGWQAELERLRCEECETLPAGSNVLCMMAKAALRGRAQSQPTAANAPVMA